METTYTKLIEKLVEHTKLEKPNECVGIITTKFEYVPCTNISSAPKDTFILDPVKFYELQKECWGIYHSHPEEEDVMPSFADNNDTLFTNLKYIVGNGNQFYLYWKDSNINAIRVEKFSEKHLCS